MAKKQKTKETNWFAIIITSVAVLVIGAFAILAVVGNKAVEKEANTGAVTPASASINKENGAITIGEGPNVIEEYFDFMCGHCGQFYKGFADTIKETVADGRTTLRMHPIAILDTQSVGTEYSTRAANAAYCVTEENPDAAYPFIDLLFKNQPAQGTPGLDDAQLISYAEAAGAPNAGSCITDGTFKDFVTEMTQKTPIIPGQENIATPTVKVNDEFINVGGTPENEVIARLTK